LYTCFHFTNSYNSITATVLNQRMNFLAIRFADPSMSQKDVPSEPDQREILEERPQETVQQERTGGAREVVKSRSYSNSFHTHDYLSTIKYPIFSDKGFRLIEQSQYIFAVDVRATKPLIKTSLEQLFDVKVDSVNTSLPAAKKRSRGRFKVKRSRYKRAFVKLASGSKIKIFEDADSEE